MLTFMFAFKMNRLNELIIPNSYFVFKSVIINNSLL